MELAPLHLVIWKVALIILPVSINHGKEVHLDEEHDNERKADKSVNDVLNGLLALCNIVRPYFGQVTFSFHVVAGLSPRRLFLNLRKCLIYADAVHD